MKEAQAKQVEQERLQEKLERREARRIKEQEERNKVTVKKEKVKSSELQDNKQYPVHCPR